MKKRRHVFNWLKDNKYEICFLQELHCKKSDYIKWENEWQSTAFFSGNSSNSQGIGILLQKSPFINVIEYKELINGRIQCLTVEIHEHTITLLNVYAPNTDDILFFNYI